MIAFFETVVQDLRYGARGLFRDAAFSAVSILALALGIGVNTAAFTAYQAIVARPLDARDSARMANLALRLPSGAIQARFSYPDYETYRAELRSFSGVIAFAVGQLKLTDAGGVVSQRSARTGSLMGQLGLFPGASNAEFTSAFLVSANYFSVLGVPVVKGRSFESMSAAELRATPPVLISENYWQRRFAGDPKVLGKTIRLNGAAFTIVGITPRDFVGTSGAVPNFWLPLSLDRLIHPESNRLNDRDDLFCRVFGRLAPGVSREAAQTETTIVATQLRALHARDSDLSGDVEGVISPGSPLPQRPNASLRLTILLIRIAVGMVLVIACANVASLQLARATTRQQELGMRLSLGASRQRLIRQLLTESALTGAIAGAVALPLTWALMKVAVTRAAEALPVEFGVLILNVDPSPEIFGYVSGISVVAGILFGLAPALESSRSALFSVVRGQTSVRGNLRQLLIAAQVAVSLALMIAGGLLVRSANRTLTMETGYDADKVIALSLQFPEEARYTVDEKAAKIPELATRIAALAGIETVTSARAPNDSGGRRAAVEGTVLYYTFVQPNYFQTLGIKIAEGHPPSGHDVTISESAAHRLWPGQNAIGKNLRLDTEGQFHNKGELLPDGPTWRVVGIARDTRGVTLDRKDAEQVYLPLPESRRQDYPLLLRTHSDPTQQMRAIDAVISKVDPNLSASAQTLQEMLRQTDAFIIASTVAAIASTISLFGLLLASMGIYSTVSYVVVLRTKEIGIRMAIGAKQRDILTLMLRDNARAILAGLVAGITLAAATSRLLRGVLYGLDTVDPTSFAGASVLFLSIALAATWIPSRRALRVDPLVALRYE